MVKKILLVGCGNIGSRHLQSIVKLPPPISFTILEPDLNSQKIAKSRLNENKSFVNDIFWKTSISEIKETFDLVIIATNAENRKDMINDLLELGNKRFLIEKMVCQSKQDYESIIKKIHSKNATGWVNTNRRYFPFYQKIKDNISSNENLKLTVTTGNNGLGSNAIHFIDLFLWFTNSKTISLNGEFLTDKIYPNKRQNHFTEFSGTIIGTDFNSIVTISFLPIDDLPFVIEIVTNKFHIIINETNEKIFKIRDILNIEPSFKYLLVSDLTYGIVSDILKNDACCLPKIEELFLAHCELFKIFNFHIKKLTDKEPTLCPIT